MEIVNGYVEHIIFQNKENGYAVLAVNRDGEQSFLLSGEVPAKLMAANINVRADVGKVALIKGPFVYCLEEKDNGSNLAALRIGTDAEIQEAPLQESLPGDIPALKVKGQRVTATTKDSNLLYGEPGFRVEEQELTAIPYCLWGTRGSGEMRVFVDAA